MTNQNDQNDQIWRYGHIISGAGAGSETAKFLLGGNQGVVVFCSGNHGLMEQFGGIAQDLHPGRLRWNLKGHLFEKEKKSSKSSVSGSMLIFQGVVLMYITC